MSEEAKEALSKLDSRQVGLTDFQVARLCAILSHHIRTDYEEDEELQRATNEFIFRLYRTTGQKLLKYFVREDENI